MSCRSYVVFHLHNQNIYNPDCHISRIFGHILHFSSLLLSMQFLWDAWRESSLKMFAFRCQANFFSMMIGTPFQWNKNYIHKLVKSIDYTHSFQQFNDMLSNKSITNLFKVKCFQVKNNWWTPTRFKTIFQ